ncbi:uncharacterized protein LOC126898499 [Daktulosphaira vitifoliae]|uniref:uncharacterized protein LOC126898499 n=1 Tax=Daktulosphaira vitifoliae TaxID=58002 RepID=UPI0021A9EF7E|nr:uncharacterized protein LOC126898499 [Daktulosphaira vitifoliae]
MKSAMDALDSLHYLPWAHFKENCKNQYIMSPLLEKIGDFSDKLNERTVSRNDIFTYSSVFKKIDLFSKNIKNELLFETNSYCEYASYNENYLWDEWIQEYNAIIKHDEKLVFLKFLTRKCNDYIKTVIIEYYFQLGFKYDPITEEIFLPTPGELIIQELELKATDDEPPTLLQIETH